MYEVESIDEYLSSLNLEKMEAEYREEQEKDINRLLRGKPKLRRGKPKLRARFITELKRGAFIVRIPKLKTKSFSFKKCGGRERAFKKALYWRNMKRARRWRL